MPEYNQPKYYAVYFQYEGKSGAVAHSADFIMPKNAMFHEIEAKAEEAIISFFDKIFPECVMAVLPIPKTIKIIPGCILQQHAGGKSDG